MQAVVEYNTGKVAQVHLVELAAQLEEMVRFPLQCLEGCSHVCGLSKQHLHDVK